MKTTTIPEVDSRELVRLLRQPKGAFPVTLLTRTRPKLKAGNPWPCGSVTKECSVNGMANFVFERSVQRHVDPEFQVGHRLWGTHDAKARCIVHHKGKLYLELKVEHCTTPVYRDQEGRVVPTEEIAPYLREAPERSVNIKAYGFDSIYWVTFGGATYALPQGA